ncbi:MAG TPA: chemotaxis response regulator protein-glutamate methylesterase [Bacillota bacterium]|nr:chemotaxis response regulator protein-glutamate methylesterase [Bacillota bacterium]
MPIRVLIVDDSAFMRQIFFRMMSNDPELMVVGTARDGLDALKKIEHFKPDVVTLDVAMPNMDGLECLAKLMAENPLPVIMVSSLTIEGAEPTIRALELGALDYVTKSSATRLEDMDGIQQELIQKIKVAAGVKVSRLERPEPIKLAETKARKIPEPVFAQEIDLELLAIGSSTGGPKALYYLLPLFPKTFPLGIVVAQHMPKDFTGVFAKRLNALCQLEVAEAKHGDKVEPGKILIAPSGYQSRVVKQGNSLVVHIFDQPEFLYKPSVDNLFHSLAEATKGKVLSIILTGMGSDGAAGMKKLRDLGARTIAEAEESCVVFGMPRVAIELGGAEYVESLPNIYTRITTIINSKF